MGTQKFDFGSKVRFKASRNIHPELIGRDFCLVGFDNTAFAIIDWHKRGGYDFEFYTGDVNVELELIPEKCAIKS